MNRNVLCMVKLIDNIESRIESLKKMLTQVEEKNVINTSDLSISKDIHAYIEQVLEDYYTMLNVYNDNIPIIDVKNAATNLMKDTNNSKIIRTLNNHELYNEEIVKFETKVDLHTDNIINLVELTTDKLIKYQGEYYICDSQIESLYKEINSQKEMVNKELDIFNNTENKRTFQLDEWRISLKQKNEKNRSLINEAQKLLLNYSHSMSTIKTNTEQIVSTIKKKMGLQFKCCELEDLITREGQRTLKCHRTVLDYIEKNERKFDFNKQIVMNAKHFNALIDNNSEAIKCSIPKMMDNLFRLHTKVLNVNYKIEEKFWHLNTLNTKCLADEQLLTKSQGYHSYIISDLKEIEKNILNKQQQIENEKSNIQHLQDNLNDKTRAVKNVQHLMQSKELELKEVKLKHDRELKYLEEMKLAVQKQKDKLQILNYIENHQIKEKKEKKKFYQSHVVLPLNSKLTELNKRIKYDVENMLKNNLLHIKQLDFESQQKLDNAISNNLKMDASETVNMLNTKLSQFQGKFQNIQSNVFDKLETNIKKIEQFINIFLFIINYIETTDKNIEARQKSHKLECEIFQKQYEVKKKKEKFEKDQNEVMQEFKELKKIVRQEVLRNKELTKLYNSLY